MATATMTRRAVKVRMTLTINGTDFEIRPFLDEMEGLSIGEWKHGLKQAGRRMFHVYPRSWYDRNRHRVENLDCWHCERCGTGSCQHVEALLAIGLN